MSTTILLPKQAEAYIYTRSFEVVGEIKVNGWWEWHGVRIPTGHYVVAVYIEGLADLRRTVEYQCDRIASGMHPSWAREVAPDGEVCWYLALRSSEWASDEQVRAL